MCEKCRRGDPLSEDEVEAIRHFLQFPAKELTPAFLDVVHEHYATLGVACKISVLIEITESHGPLSVRAPNKTNPIMLASEHGLDELMQKLQECKERAGESSIMLVREEGESELKEVSRH